MEQNESRCQSCTGLWTTRYWKSGLGEPFPGGPGGPGGLGGPFPGGHGGPGGFEDFIDEDDGTLGGAIGWPGVGHFLAGALPMASKAKGRSVCLTMLIFARSATMGFTWPVLLV